MCLLCLVASAWYNVFKVHSCCSMYQSVPHSYFWSNNIPLCEYTTFYLRDYVFIHVFAYSYVVILIFLKFIYFIYLLFLAALGLRCCVWAFSSCSERGLLFVVVRRLLIAVASLVAEHRLWVRGLQ